MRTILFQKCSFTLILIILMCSQNSLALLGNLFSSLDPENVHFNFTDLAAKYGHPATEYEVVTEDGYILTLFRLPGKSRTPILLTHGVEDSSDTFIIRGNESLGIVLANRGYDVWLGNFRGNRYSRRHQYLNPDLDDSFWDFSFHEVGYFDLPAFIDEVLNETKVQKLAAVGHSQGNTAYYVLGSTRREYNLKISIMIALGPICFLQNLKFPVSLAVKTAPLLNELAAKLSITEFFGDNSKMRKMFNAVCPIPLIGYAICGFGFLFPLAGYDPVELEQSFLPISTKHFPAGTSWKSLGHLLQVGHQKEFSRYDYGSKINHDVYNSSTPPIYNLSEVTMPVALLAARNDHLSTLEDISLLRKRLSNVVSYIIIPRKLCNHVDEVWGRRMYVYLYPSLFKVLSQYVEVK